MKEILRKQALLARSALSLVEKNQKEQDIMERLLPLLKDKQTIAIYLPKGNEVDITSLLFVYTQVGAPKVRNNKKMDFYLIKGFEDVKEGAFQILEPTTTIWMDPTAIDCILVPMVAFDTKKHRIGYGKGYYDRYLSQTNAMKIGVAFTCQKVEAIPSDQHDVALDYIVCEDNIY